MSEKQIENSFGVGDLIHNGELYDYVNQTNIDYEFYKRWAQKVQGPVLELCSGTGRLTIPIKKSGVNIVGLDITKSMISRAKEKARAIQLDIDFIEGDMRSFDLQERFSLIFIPFNSIQNTYSVIDVESIFERVKHHLNRDGLFIIDIFNPSIQFMVKSEETYIEQYRFKKTDGTEVVISEKGKYDSAAQINRVKWKYEFDGKEYIDKLDMRCYYPLEMDALINYNGFEIVAKFGDYDENPFDSESKKQIFICKLKT